MMLRSIVVSALLLLFVPKWSAASDFISLPSDQRPARLAVVVYDPQGLAVTPPGYGGPEMYYNPTMAGGGLAAQAVGQEISVAIETKRRERAMGPEWKALDHDALDERLVALVHKYIDRRLLTQNAKIKDMTFFGQSKAGYLQKFTPGTVVVYHARMGLSSELGELLIQVEESIWDYRFRAKSNRELKRIPKGQVDDHRPKITRRNTHTFSYYLTVEESHVPEKLRDKPHFRKVGALWQADGSKLLLAQIEAGFAAIEASMAAAATAP